MYQEHGTLIKARRRSISFTSYYMGIKNIPASPGRSSVKGWNEGMSRRIGNYLDNFREDFTGMVTLTYPAEFPIDGVIVKRHWRAFIERLRRTGWFNQASLVWFLEFQDRGAPHFHFLTTNWLSKNWVAANWASITGGDPAVCSRVEALRNPEAAGAYARKYAQKSEQKAVPANFIHIGRMWGCCALKILHGMPRVPVVVAALIGSMPVHLFKLIDECKRLYGVRIAQTMSGYVIYGNSTEIKRSWQHLRTSIVTIDRTDNFLGDSAQRTRGAL